MGTRRAAVALACVTLWAWPASATTRTVCASGCDYTTIGGCYTASAALDVCSITDTRTYSECVTSGSKNRVTIQGPSASSRPTVACTTNNTFSWYYGNVFRNLIVTGNATYTCMADSIGGLSAVASAEFYDVDISTCGASCIYAWDSSVYIGSGGSRMILDRVVMQDCASGGTHYCLWTGGGNTNGQPALTNVVCSPHASAAGGIDLDGGTCLHCTLVGSKGSIAALKGAGGATVKYSIASGTGALIKGNTCDYNISYAGSGFDCTSNTNSSTSNPSLVSVYQIGAGSVAVDYAVGSATSVDVANVARPSGSEADAGAWEYLYPPSGGTLGNRVTNGTLGARVTGGVLGNRVE